MVDHLTYSDEKDVPFLLEDKIKSLGGIYEKNEPFAVSVVSQSAL